MRQAPVQELSGQELPGAQTGALRGPDRQQVAAVCLHLEVQGQPRPAGHQVVPLKHRR